MKKQTKNILIGLGILLAVILIIVFRSNNYAIVHLSSTDHTEAILVSQDEQSATYRYTWVGYNEGTPDYVYNCGDYEFAGLCTIELSETFQPVSESSLPILIDNLQLDTNFVASNIQFIANADRVRDDPNYNTDQHLTVTQNQSSGTCKALDEGGGKAKIVCNLQAGFYAKSSSGIPVGAVAFYPSTVATATVKIYKAGYNPATKCDYPNILLNGVCVNVNYDKNDYEIYIGLAFLAVLMFLLYLKFRNRRR